MNLFYLVENLKNELDDSFSHLDESTVVKKEVVIAIEEVEKVRYEEEAGKEDKKDEEITSK